MTALPWRRGSTARRVGIAALALVTLLTIALPASATLTGSTFESGDGNLAVDGPTTTHDWDTPVEAITCGATIPSAGTNCGTDLAKNTGDNSLGQGAKEDLPNPAVTSGSIPPNKSDLIRFYVNKEHANGDDFLYLAWERSNVLGSANMDFEINQKRCDTGATPTNCQANGVTPLRTVGDMLVRFDFTNGGGNPILSLLRWIPAGTAGATSADCYKNNALPCWGVTDADPATSVIGGDGLDGKNDQQINLSAAGFAEGAVNATDLTDTRAPGPVSLPALTFGEAGINLTDSDIFSPSTCAHFGSAFLKSRSAAAFDAELKDFIAPVPIDLSNCGSINIIKHTTPRGIDHAFGFTSTIPNPGAGSTQPSCTADTSPSAFSLNDKDFNPNATQPVNDTSTNTESCVNVPAGTYTVTENSLSGTDFSLDSIACGGATGVKFGYLSSGAFTTGANDSSKDGFDAGDTTVQISLVAGSTVTCTFTNKQQLGAIQVNKTAKDANCAGSTPPADCIGSTNKRPLAGATFQLYKENGKATGFQSTGTNADDLVTSGATGTAGTKCFGSLSFATYYVHESAAPTGYAADANDATVTINANSTCAGSPQTASFENTPLSKIQVKFTSLAGSGVTVASIECKNGANVVAPTPADSTPNPTTLDDSDESITNLAPGTYVCTVVVDP